MVSSGSTNSVWPLELAPWITPSSLRRWPAITGTTKRSLRMVTNSSCSTPSSRCARRKRSSDSWMAFFCRSMSRRRRRQRHAGVVGDACRRAGSCRPGLAAARGNRRWSAARRPSRGKRSAAAVSTRLGVGGAVQQREQVEDFLGLQAGAFDAQLVHRRLHVGQAAEIDADGGAARGRLRARWPGAGTRWPRRLRPGLPRARRDRRAAATFSSSRRPSGLDIAAQLRSFESRLRRRASNSRTSALVFKSGRELVLPHLSSGQRLESAFSITPACLR